MSESQAATHSRWNISYKTNVNDLNRAHWQILLMKHTETMYNPEVSG